MCKSLFEDVEPRHALSVNRDGKSRKVQSTFKESNILCTNCEKRIEVIETVFARVFSDLYEYNSFPQKFTLCKLGAQQYLVFNEICPTLFKLFIYSIVWRASISDLYDIKKFKLAQSAEEELRAFLNTSLKLTKKELLDVIAKDIIVPSFHSCITMPKIKSPESRGILSVVSMSETAHALFLVDFALFFYTDEDSIGSVLKHFSNRQNEKVIIILGQLKPCGTLINYTLTKC